MDEIPSVEINALPIKTRRVTGRPGRFDPSEPFHMSTRRAAKNPFLNGTPSLNGSLDGDDSYRGSFDDMQPVLSASPVIQPSVSDQLLATASRLQSIKDREMDDVTMYDSPEQDQSDRDSSPLRRQTPTPSRKRKRSHSLGLTPVQKSQSDNSGVANLSQELDADEEDVDPIISNNLSARDDSQNSSQSNGILPADELEPGLSMDATPHISDPVSPATTDSVVDIHGPLAKTINDTLNEFARAAAQHDEMEDMYSADDVAEAQEADEADEAEVLEEHLRTEDEGRPRRKIGGRKRAAHAKPFVEAHLRRQAKLKSAYRTIARAQKAILAELAERTVTAINDDPEYHVQAEEHNEVEQQLDEELAKRRELFSREQNWNLLQLKERLKNEEISIKSRYQSIFKDLRDDKCDHLRLKMLAVVRVAQRSGENDACETEDEDGLTPRLKRMAYGWKRSDALDDEYDSRSRLPLHLDRATDDLAKRMEVQAMIDEYRVRDDDAQSDKTSNERFTIMDSTPREYALARRQHAEDMGTLAAAAEEVERVAKIPVIRNEDAIGLQLLGGLSMRPSIASSGAAIEDKRQMPAPDIPSKVPAPLPAPSDSRPPPIHFAMSPRAAQVLGDRLAHPMPPPSTPKQSVLSFVRSPDLGARRITPQHSTLTFVRSPDLSNAELHLPPINREESQVNGSHMRSLPSSVPRPMSQHSFQTDRFHDTAYYAHSQTLRDRPASQHSQYRDFHPGLFRAAGDQDYGRLHLPPPSNPHGRDTSFWHDHSSYHYEDREHDADLDRSRSYDTHGRYSNADRRLDGGRGDHGFALDPALTNEQRNEEKAYHSLSRKSSRPSFSGPRLSDVHTTSYDWSHQHSMERPRSAQSTGSSASIPYDSKAEFDHAESRGPRPKMKGERSSLASKSSRAERSGDSRSHLSQSPWNMPKPGSADGTSSKTSPLAPAISHLLSPQEHSISASSRQHPRHLSPPYSAQAPAQSSYHSSPYGPPTLPPPHPSLPPFPHHFVGRPAAAPDYDNYYSQHYQHSSHSSNGYSHSSFSSVPPPPPPPGWEHPPPPQASTSTAPSASQDHYGHYIPAPPPGYQLVHASPASGSVPHSGPPPSRPSQPAATDSYGQQYGGPPIAPAAASPSLSNAGGRTVGRIPAFAQRGNAPSTYRRRNTGDGFQVHKFHNYTPSGSRGSGK